MTYVRLTSDLSYVHFVKIAVTAAHTFIKSVLVQKTKNWSKIGPPWWGTVRSSATTCALGQVPCYPAVCSLALHFHIHLPSEPRDTVRKENRIYCFSVGSKFARSMVICADMHVFRS